MRKLISMLFVLTLAVVLVACGGNDNNTGNKADNSKDEDSKKGSGELVIYSPNSEDIINTIIPKFEQETGIKVELISAGTGELIKGNLLEADEIQVLDLNLWNEHKHVSAPMKTVLHYIEENYFEKITMNDLVDETGMSATYLNNCFKEMTSYTFNEYLNRYRVQKSIEIIKVSDDKISTIALDVGFSSYRYFVKVFKRYTNSLPSEFYIR